MQGSPTETTASSLMAIACEVCGRDDDDESMLLCDGCNLGFHLLCLTPPLSRVPDTPLWFCNSCASGSAAVHATYAEAEFSNAPMYEVAAIRKKRHSITRNEPEYLVHWLDFTPEHDTWEPVQP